MRNIFATVVLALVMASCTALNNAYEAVTTSNVPARSVYVAVNAFNATKATATGYIIYCTPNPTPRGCDDKVIQEKLIPAINRGTVARDTLTSYLRNNPGAMGEKGVYTTLVTATSTVKTLLGTYDKRNN